MKHPESIVHETWEIFKNSLNFHRKMPMKKGSHVKNQESIVDETLESIVDETSIPKKFYQFFRKMPM